MPTVLDKIVTYKLEEIRANKAAHNLSEMEGRARKASSPRGFCDALKKAKQKNTYGLICEIKKASPSKGLIRLDFDPPALARAYEAGGATCLSVLTDGPSFQGADVFLSNARNEVSLPVLRKDFMFDPYQVIEARGLGADCILIILAAVTDSQASELHACALEWQMDVLLEVHNEAELGRALRFSSPLIGINNRNLNTFKTTLEVSKQLAPLVPDGRFAIAESGIASVYDIAQLLEYRIDAFLIGESLMRKPDLELATRSLLGVRLN
jgi:indole-3-glycerol phosphate synthase